MIHFLHIGKTGGTAIKAALSQWDNSPIILHGHKFGLNDVPLGEKVIFFLRDPISRFVSGFYSRKRKGWPRYYSEHNILESKVFNAFSTPNDLGCALAYRGSRLHGLAREALQGIGHFSHFDLWYQDLNYFNSRLSDILFIGFTESLDADFKRLKTELRIPSEINLPTDDVGAHRNPSGVDKYLSTKALSALSEYYEEDIIFLNYCRKVRSNLIFQPTQNNSYS